MKDIIQIGLNKVCAEIFILTKSLLQSNAVFSPKREPEFLYGLVRVRAVHSEMLKRHCAHSICELLICFVGVVCLDVMQVADALCTKNFMGETPLMQAAGASKPGAFQVVEKMLTASEVRWSWRIQHCKNI